jgi:hypothetical protein
MRKDDEWIALASIGELCIGNGPAGLASAALSVGNQMTDRIGRGPSPVQFDRCVSK